MDVGSGVLAVVAVFRLARLGLGLVRLGRLARSTDRLAPPAPARELLARFPTPAAFVQPTDFHMPCSFGLFRPTVVLPAAFDRLEPAFQRGIVCHELLHLERRDFAAAVAEEVAAALLWFHPWAWLIHGRIRLHREQVVDAAVVRRTGGRRAYVRCLIALAGHPRALSLAAPMLRPTELRARADALFEKDGTMSRRASAEVAIGLGAALAATLWTAAATVPLSAATAPAPPGPAAREPAARTGPPAIRVMVALLVDARRPEAPGAGLPAASAGSRAPRSADANQARQRTTAVLQEMQQALAAMSDQLRNDAKDTDANHPATCQEQEPAESGLRLGVCAVERCRLLAGLVGRPAEPKATMGGLGAGGKTISITVLRRASWRNRSPGCRDDSPS